MTKTPSKKRKKKKEVSDQMDAIAEAMKAEEIKNIDELSALSRADSEESDQELAEQIAEDIALQKEEEQLSEQVSEEKSSRSQTPLDVDELQSCIEAFLFMSDRPVSEKKLKQAIGSSFKAKDFKAALENLRERYSHPYHGIELAEVNDGHQLRTKPIRADLLKGLSKVQPHRLSRGAMESLAIIAYKQPVMKEQIDQVRGVDSSHFIRTLLEKRLIQISGRSELPGRPMLYTTTNEFLEIFGLKNLEDLPPLQEIEQMVPRTQAGQEEVDPKIKKIQDMIEKMRSEKERLEYDPREDDRILREIRENVRSVDTSTPYLKSQDEKEKEGAQPDPEPTLLEEPKKEIPQIEIPAVEEEVLDQMMEGTEETETPSTDSSDSDENPLEPPQETHPKEPSEVESS